VEETIINDETKTNYYVKE